MNKLLSILFSLLFFSAFGHAQVEAVSESELIEKRYTLYFRVNKSDIDPAYMENAHTIETMVNDIKATLESSGAIPGKITVYASTSPEGPKAVNDRLATARAKTSRDFILQMFPQFDPEQITVESRVDDWSGLILAVRRDTTAMYRDLILNILNDSNIADKDAALRRHPAAYAELRKEFLGNMRYAAIQISVVKTETNVDIYVLDHNTFTLSEDCVEFTAEGDTMSVISYTKTAKDMIVPAVTSGKAWATIGSVTPDSTIFSVAPNRSKKPRSTDLTFSIYEKDYTVKLNQAGREPELTLTSNETFSVPAEGGETTITYETNVTDGETPVVRSNSPYVHVLSVDAEKAVVKIDENVAEEAREDLIEVVYEGKTYTVKSTQDGAQLKKPYYLAVKNNMLYDLGIVPNVGVEIYLGKNFSVVGNWMYAWWKDDNIHWYWRIYGGDLAFRYWFGKASKEKPLQGHHLGLYGQIITYDFELGGKGILAPKWSWSAGAEYGYSLPIARRLNIDFTLGVGYHKGQFYEYLPIDGHYVWQATKRRQYIGPTKAEISLVWQLGRGNINAGKGGKR